MRKICFFVLAMVACLYGFTITGYAQTAQHTALRNSVFLGEPLHIQTTISGVNNIKDWVNLPLVDTGKQWFLVGDIALDTSNLSQAIAIKYQVVCFDSGNIALTFTTGRLRTGTNIRSTMGNAITIKVLPVPIRDMKQLHPAEPLLIPQKMEDDTKKWRLLMLLLFLLVMAMLVFWWRKKASSKNQLIQVKGITPNYETLLTQQPNSIEQWQQWAADVYTVLYHEFPELKNITASKKWPSQVPTSLQNLYGQISFLLFAKAIPASTTTELLEPFVHYLKQKNK